MAPIAPGEHDGPASRWDGALPTHMSHNDQHSQIPPLVPPPPPTTPPPAPQQRRLSMEEDYLYQEVINTTSCQLSQRRESLLRRSGAPGAVGPLRQPQDAPPEYENLPPYSCSVHIEAVFMKKLEVENATKRAEDRRWHPVYAILHGTALNVYQVKKDWGWGKKTDTSRTGAQAQPDPGGGIGIMNLEANKPSEDNPLGVKAGKLQKSYGLLHADVGIAADYRKRRYVIRVRAESDQFLLSCLELETFVRWLDALFAAIDIAAPIEDRDFPRDQSIPRIQRLRWLRGEGGALRPGDRPHPAAAYAAEAATVSSSERPRVRTVTERGSGGSHSTANALARAAGVERRGIIINANGQIVEDRRLSRDSRTSTIINFTTDGKWSPRHAWTRRHDMLYAKLCYSTLLFRSPRKSNYVIMQGDQWYVDWPTGRMVRVQPPTYSENMAGGPFFTAHVGHARI